MSNSLRYFHRPLVSVVIVNWNTRELLKQCLYSLFKHTPEELIETIVVDNASIDDSVQMVEELFPQVKVISNSENVGFAGANNQGIDVAWGKYVLLLNSDTILQSDFISALVNFAQEHPDGAVFGPKVLNADGTIQQSTFMFPSLLNMTISSLYLNKLFKKNRFFAREQMTWWDRRDIRQVDVVSGCCMLVRDTAIEEVGTLDQSYFMYAEETDWCYRFKKAGWKIWYAPVGSVVHLGGQSSKTVKERMLIQLRLSILRFFGKHYSRASYTAACILTAMFFTLRLPAWALIGLIGGQRRSQAPTRIKAYAAGTLRVLEATMQNPGREQSL